MKPAEELPKPSEAPTPPPDLVADCISHLEKYLDMRAKALQLGDTTEIRSLYDTSVRTGRWALEHQERRAKYVATWAAKRGITLTSSSASMRVVRTKKRASSVWLYVIQSSDFSYFYDDDPAKSVNRFGIGTRHVMELVFRNGNWLFQSDWFTDPLDEDTLIPEVVPALSTGAPEWATPREVMRGAMLNDDTPMWLAQDVPLDSLPVASSARRYSRAAAVAYADKYCGAAMGCGNNGRYNQKYRDYTGLGGDCTNFVSQVLGDPEGGGLHMTSTWRYAGKGGGSAGSTAWIQTNAFAQYLQYSGMATRIAKAVYKKVAAPTPERPQGLVGTLKPGDIIGYQEKGDVVHFAIITALDSRGIPLVNSHTADRFHVPWDLGWDRNTVYWLYRMSG